MPAAARTSSCGWEWVLNRTPGSCLSSAQLCSCPLCRVTDICGWLSLLSLLSSGVRIADPSQKGRGDHIWILVSTDSSWRRGACSPCSHYITSLWPQQTFPSLRPFPPSFQVLQLRYYTRNPPGSLLTLYRKKKSLFNG